MSIYANMFELKVNWAVTPSSGGVKTFTQVYHYFCTASPLPTPAAVITAFDNGPASGIAGLLNVDCVGTTYDCREMSNANNQYTTVANGQTGGTTGDRLPMDMAVCFLLRTGARGRNFRGSKHYGPITEADTLRDELTTGKVTSWNAVGTAISGLLSVTGGSLRPVVFSASLSQTRTNPTTLIGEDITAALLNKNIGTMRRRREKTVR